MATISNLPIAYRLDGANKGLHVLFGVTLLLKDPYVIAPKRQVHLFTRQKQPVLIGMRLSDAAGEWRFDGLHNRKEDDGYVVMAYDRPPDTVGQYDPAAKDNRRPSMMLPDSSEH